MTKDTLRAVLENVVLGLLAVLLGWMVPAWFPIGVPPSALVSTASQDPAGIDLPGLLLILVGFVGAGWWRSWPACLFALLFGASMISVTAERLEIHRAAPLWVGFHPYGSALVLLAPGILAALVGAGLGGLTRRFVPRPQLEDASVVAERRRWHGHTLKFIGAGVIVVPLVLVLDSGNPFAIAMAMQSVPVGVLLYLLGVVTGAKDMLVVGKIFIGTSFLAAVLFTALLGAGHFDGAKVALGFMFLAGVLIIALDLLFGALRLLFRFVRKR